MLAFALAAVAAACAGDSPLGGGDAGREEAALIALQTAFLADDCDQVVALAAGFSASTDLRLHAVTTMYGRCLWRRGDAAGAVTLLARVAYVDPPDAAVPGALFWLGRARIDADDAVTALADLARFRERFAHHIYFDDAIYYSGKAHAVAGDPTAAIADFAAVLALPGASDSLRVEASYETALALVQRAAGDAASPDLELAYGWFETVRNDFASSVYADNAAYHLGRVRFDQGRWAEAEALELSALADWPTSTWRPSMGYVLGRARYELGLLGPAIEAFAITLEDATSLYHDNALYYTGRSWYRLALNDPERYPLAIGFFDRVLAEHPTSSYADDAAYFRARAYFELEDLERADAAFALIPTSFPTSPYLDNALHYLVLVRLALDDCAGARAALDALAAITPPSSFLASTQAVFAGSPCAAVSP
ncbi:MAG: tetratricopeptide repeat protein [Myxococcota bacterium]